MEEGQILIDHIHHNIRELGSKEITTHSMDLNTHYFKVLKTIPDGTVAHQYVKNHLEQLRLLCNLAIQLRNTHESKRVVLRALMEAMHIDLALTIYKIDPTRFVFTDRGIVLIDIPKSNEITQTQNKKIKEIEKKLLSINDTIESLDAN